MAINFSLKKRTNQYILFSTLIVFFFNNHLVFI